MRHVLHRAPVQLYDRRVETANDQQGRGTDEGQIFAREIRASPARYDGVNPIGPTGRGDECSAGACAGAEQPDRKSPRIVLSVQPAHRADQAPGKQTDIETKVPSSGIDLLLPDREQIEQQRPETFLPERLGDKPVAGGMTATPGAVREHYKAAGTRRNCKISFELNAFRVDHDSPFHSLC